MEQKLMVFWKYDLFPYMLCGELEKIHDDGFVIPVGYQGRRFRPIKILPFDRGLIIKNEIDKLVAEDKKLREDIRKKSKERLAELML